MTQVSEDPRYANLTKIRPRKRLDLAPPPEEPQEPAEEAASAAPAEPAKASKAPRKAAPAPKKKPPASRKQSAKAAPVSEQASKLERVPVRIEAELHAKLTEKTAETGLSQTGIVLAAIESAHTQDAFDFAAPGTSLFVGAAGRRRGPARATVMIDVRPRTEDLATLKELEAQHKAPNTSAFIVAALEHYLLA